MVIFCIKPALRLVFYTAVGLCGFMLAACSTTEEDPTKGWPVEQLYGEAHDKAEAENCKEALPLFEKVQSRYPFGIYAQQSHLESIYCHYKLEDWAMAYATADSFIKQYPSHSSLDYVYYAQGMANLQYSTGFWAWLTLYDKTYLDPRANVEALQSFTTLLEKFPKSKFARAAEAQRHFLQELLAGYEYNVALHYYEYGAYVASARRSADAIKTYPYSQHKEKLLTLLAQSYQALDMDLLAYDTVRVLQKNFPQNEFVKNYRIPDNIKMIQ